MILGRREFLAGMGGLGAGLGLGAISHWLPLPPPDKGPDWSPGRETFVPSTCLLCPSRCGIRGRVVDGNLVRIDGNPLHPVSAGGLCPKGAAGIQLLYHPARLTGPVERVGPPGSDQFRRVTWEEAAARLTAALTELRSKGEADSVMWVAGDTPGIMEELIRRFARVYGTPHLIREDYADGAADVMRLCQGIPAPPAFDLSASDLVLSFGASLSEAWWCLPQAARAREAARGSRPRWVQLDVRLSRTAARADQWVPVRPGSYGAVALGIAYVLLKEGLYNPDRVREDVAGLEDTTDENGRVVPGFRTLVLRHGRTEEVSRRTGVPAETLVLLGKTFAGASRPVAVWDQAVAWRAGGLSDALAIQALNLLVGAPGRPGGVLVQPPLPVPPIDEEQLSVEADRPVSAPGRFDWAERIASGSAPAVKALFLYYANPVASSPDAAQVARALERVPLVVSFSPFLDESARRAHLVLPDHIYLERWQDAPAPASVPIPVWGLVQPVVPPRHDTRATGDLILDVASRLGGEVAAQFPWTSLEQIVRERGMALSRATRGGLMDQPFQRDELRELEARGWWLPHRMSEDEFWSSLRERGGWFDPYYDYHDRSAVSRFADGRLRIFPREARDRIAARVPGLTEGFLSLPEAEDPAGGRDAYPLRLVPFRVMTIASGTTALMPWLLENLGVLTADAWETWVEMNPATGRLLGLSTGQVVRVESEAGAFIGRLRLYAGAQPGVVNVPYGLHMEVEGWGRAPACNPLRAVGARRDPSSDLPDWYSGRVRVVPA